MEKQHYTYSVDGLNFEGGYELTEGYFNEVPPGQIDIEIIAQDAAENFWNDHDGWEMVWPRKFFIFGRDGTLFGTCNVVMESVPEFTATFEGVK